MDPIQVNRYRAFRYLLGIPLMKGIGAEVEGAIMAHAGFIATFISLRMNYLDISIRLLEYRMNDETLKALLLIGRILLIAIIVLLCVVVIYSKLWS